MKKFLALSALVVASSNASAYVISPSNWGPCVGTNSCTVEDATLASVPGNFQEKTQDGLTGLGVSGNTIGEININELVSVTFGHASKVDMIELMLLFNGPEYGDVAEVAKITADGQDYTLSISSLADNLASWSGLGTVENCGATVNGARGCFRIYNPFGDAEVSALLFTALPGGTPLGGEGYNESDYAISKISVVPEPGTLALLGAGLFGLGAARRKQQ